MIHQSRDWLDNACWKCGSFDVIPEEDHPLLCEGCRQVLSQPLEDGLETFRRVYWQSHVLERCWLCLIAQVDSEDDLGLCVRCRLG